MIINRLKENIKTYGLFRKIIKYIGLLIDVRDNLLTNQWLKKQEAQWIKKNTNSGVLFSILVPIYNTPENYLDEMVSSVLNQTYDNWELILVDDYSSQKNIRKKLKSIAERDQRIKVVYLNKNQGIAAATNHALREAIGDFVVLFDHDDILHKRALESVSEEIEKHPAAMFLYTDEAKIDDKNTIYQPFLKPAWNYDLLRSVNYITHLTVVKRELMLKVGGENGKYNGAQDWDLFIRLTQCIDEKDIVHIPKVLYYWRVHQQSTAGSVKAKPYVLEAQKNTLKDNIDRNNIPADIVYDKKNYGQWYEKYNPIKNPKVIWCVWGDRFDLRKNIDYIVFIQNNRDRSAIENIGLLAAEASRDDIGMVVPYIKNKKIVMNNLRGILSKESVNIIKKLSWRSVSKHIYMTTKYSLSEVDAPIAIVEVKKIRQVMRNDVHNITSRTLSKRLAASGYRTLYNPHIRVKEGI